MVRRGEADEARRHRMWETEHALFAEGVRWVAGVDEAGRGPLAGPVVVAGVILPPDWWAASLNDSKKLTAPQRDQLHAAICAEAVAWTIAVVPPDVIDTRNILGATHFGMRRVLTQLSQPPEVALIDGLPLPHCPVPQRALVKGDARSASIAAASILAKVTRDALLCALDLDYPGYGFAQHKGYPTPEHLAALRLLGPCPAHRRSFAPVRACVHAQMQLDDGEGQRP
jgi:ribonuclease HII